MSLVAHQQWPVLQVEYAGNNNTNVQRTLGDKRCESNTRCSKGTGHIDRTHQVKPEKPRVKEEGEKTKLFTIPLASLTFLPVPSCLAH
jgi:hypothetical protein